MKFVWPILESILSTQLCSFITFKITILCQNLFLFAMVLVLEQKTLSHNQTMGMDYYWQCYDGLHIFSIKKIVIHSQYKKDDKIVIVYVGHSRYIKDQEIFKVFTRVPYVFSIKHIARCSHYIKDIIFSELKDHKL